MKNPPQLLLTLSEPRWYRALIWGLLVICALVRLPSLATHFTHSDDVIVARLILRNSDPAQVLDLFERKARKAVTAQDRKEKPTSRGLLLARLEQSPFWTDHAKPGVVALYPFVAGPAELTYAPVQFVWTALLVDKAQPYRTKLVRGRLPSFIFSLVSVLALFSVLRRVPDPLSTETATVAAVIMLLSLELSVYGMQMSNYALGVLCAAATLGLAFRTTPVSPWGGAGLGAFLLLLVLCQYQIVLLVPAVFLAQSLQVWRKRDSSLRIGMGYLGLAALVFLAGLLPVFAFRIRDIVSVHWNAGPAGEFLFQPPINEGFVAVMAYAARFLTTNLYLTFSAMTSSVPEGTVLFVPVTIVLALSAVIGFIRLLRTEQWKTRPEIPAFLLTVSGTWLALVFLGRITLSPTRHSLILLPFFAWVCGRGFAEMLASMRHYRPALTLALVLTMAICHWRSWTSFMLDRRDPFNETETANMLRQHHVQAVFGDFAVWNLELMPTLTPTAMYALSPAEPLPPPTTCDSIALATTVNRPPLRYISEQGWNLVDTFEYYSDQEIDVCRSTKNVNNQVWILVLKRTSGASSNPPAATIPLTQPTT